MSNFRWIIDGPCLYPMKSNPFRVKSLRKLKAKDLLESMRRIRPSTTESTVQELKEWTQLYGEE